MTFGLFMILLGAASLSAQLVHLIDRLERPQPESAAAALRPDPWSCWRS